MPILTHNGDYFTFVPVFDVFPHGDYPAWTDQEYADETMLFSADWDFAHAHGGPLTQHVLRALTDFTRLHDEAARAPDLHIVIDTRIHMLMPGMIPAIGGWHCDAVPRPGGAHKDQPDPRLYDPRVQHYTMTLSQAATSQTAFVTDPVRVHLPPGVRVWTAVHAAVADTQPNVMYAPHGAIVNFDQGTIHKATPAVSPGWRFFFRASLYNSIPRNQIRRQVQVYIPHEGHGW